jgi:hypothetical protein
MKVKWEDKIITGTAEDILKSMVSNPWTGTLKELKKRFKEYHGIEIKETDPEKILEIMDKVGEIEIVS